MPRGDVPERAGQRRGLTVQPIGEDVQLSLLVEQQDRHLLAQDALELLVDRAPTHRIERRTALREERIDPGIAYPRLVVSVRRDVAAGKLVRRVRIVAVGEGIERHLELAAVDWAAEILGRRELRHLKLFE